jgi:putative transposase
MLLDQLNAQGIEIGRKCVKTLIPRGTQVQRMGIAALYCKPDTSKKHP